MKVRWLFAGILALAALAAAGTAVYTWSAPDGGSGIFIAFAALLGVLAWDCARPPRPRREVTGTRFAPAWFLEGAVLVAAVLLLLAVATCVFRGRQ